MKSLAYYQAKLENRLLTLQSAFVRCAVSRETVKRTDRYALQEGLISQTWQVWSSFSRAVILASLKGTTSATGMAVRSAYSVHTVDEIRFAAMRAAQGATSIPYLKSISGDHQEPTWGDLGKVNRIVSTLRPTNEAKLLSAFGSAMLISDLQRVRNACAHLSQDRINDIRNMQVRYSQTGFLHPSDSMFWVDPKTMDYSWTSWTDEMKLVAMVAIE